MNIIKYGKPTVIGAVTGVIAGLGTITAASGFVGPGGALLIGIIAAVFCFNFLSLVKHILKIDDSLDVFPIHGIGGIIGTLLIAVFASNKLDIFRGQGIENSILVQLKIQFIGVVSITIYTVIITYIILKITGLITKNIRISKNDEKLGLDSWTESQ